MDKYVRVKQIGEGSFGKALLMKRKDDGKMCVIKEIGISKMSRKEQEDSKKEVKVLSRLTHVNIVTYLESFEGKGNLYIVMDYCDGGDLYQFIRNQRGVPIEENKVLDIFVQCCLAIKYVHDRKILHRDIKTQNIFLMKDNTVKLGDFGIARVLKSTVELAHTCIGTPYYLSPEIVENRPYNNKSDIWSLGCVLYEMVTLKHAFEAGNMKNLVMKIVRGSYPPISNRYSFEIRSLVAATFKRSPSERPSINTILKKPVIQKRVEKFVPQEKPSEENQDIPAPKPKPKPAAPVSVVEPAKKPIAVKRRDDIANIYGASLAKKPNRKPPNVVNAAVKPKKKGIQLNRKSSNENTKEIAARDRRRKNLVEAEKKHLEQMKKMQQERWQKQNLDQMKMARGAGWRNILESPEEVKEKKVDSPPSVDNQQKRPVQIVKEEAAKKEEKPVQPVKNLKDLVEQKPSNHPANQKEPSGFPQKPQINLVDGNLNAERGKLLEDYWQRKKEAEANKMRAHQDVYGKVNWKPPTPNKVVGNVNRNKPPLAHPAARNKQEQEYLRQLEAIRYQNFIERREVNRKEGKTPGNNRDGDPRFDPEARKKKIQDLRKQAEERGAFLLQKHKHVEKPALQKPEEKMRNKMLEERNPDKRPLPVHNKVKKEEMVIPPVGIDTAMGQVHMPKMMRSLSEGDLQEVVNKVSHVRRKNWNAPNHNINGIGLANLPMEITASAMEATTEENTEDKRIGPVVDLSDKRKNWVHEGKTQFVANLHNKQINMTLAPTLAFSERTSSEDHLKNVSIEKTENVMVAVQPVTTDESCIKNVALHPDVSTSQHITSSMQNSPLTTNNTGSSSISSNSPGSKTITISKDSEKDKIHETRVLPIIEHTTNDVCIPPSTDTFIISPRKPNISQCKDNPIQPDIQGNEQKIKEPFSDSNQNVGSSSVLSSEEDDCKKSNNSVILENVGSTVVLSSKDDAHKNSNSSVMLENVGATVVLSTKEDECKNSNSSVMLENVGSTAMIPTKEGNYKNNNSLVVLESKTSALLGNENSYQHIPAIENICIKEPNAPSTASSATCSVSPSDTIKYPKDNVSDNIEPSEDINIEDIDEHCEDELLFLSKENLPLSMKAPVEAWSESTGSAVIKENGSKHIFTPSDSHVSSDDIEEEFHTPSRTLGLQTGVYDTATKLLRTCSLPELNTLPFFSPPDGDFDNDDDNDNNSALTPVNLEEKLSSEGDNDASEKCLEEDPKEDETELYIEEFDEDEEEDDYASMLESMCDLLSNTDEDIANDGNDTNEEDSVDWESDDDDEVCLQTAKAKDLKMKEDQFSRNEESRKILEDELGLDLFLKVYRHLQAMQDDENDELELGTVEISQLLGDKENLYQKILYLVMADAAYCEGNDGLE